MLREGSRDRGMGLSEEAPEGTRPGCWFGSENLSDQSELSARLHTRAHRGHLSGRRLVSLLFARRARTRHSGTFDRRTNCGGLRVRPQSVATTESMSASTEETAKFLRET